MFSSKLWLLVTAFVAGGYFAMHSPEVAVWINQTVEQAKAIWILIQQNLPIK